MSKLTDLYPVGTPVRVTYEFEGEMYFFDGEVTLDETSHHLTNRKLIGYVRPFEGQEKWYGHVQNVYEGDTVESLESLHTPKES